ncbi:MAG: 23S rRNA (uracil(1939)-C(5))-methyltransferase RlmD [candidate division Zixibacteria bacterium]|nr:23S rRNA (uracil(1939)-C(5))-methyltransferase RlmD [candidate division Zixibacteria bacterium]
MKPAISPTPAAMPRVGELLDVTVTDWGDQGRGIARHGNLVVLTNRGLPGETVRVRVTRRRRRHLEADLESVLVPSPHRVAAPCRHFGACGGCRLQDLDYPEQLAGKVRHLRDQVQRIGRIEQIPEIEVVPCDSPYRYRNKMEFSFGLGRDGAPTLGLHPRDNYRDSFDLEECWLTDERAVEIVAAVRSFLASGPEAVYDPVAHAGFLRFLVVRFGFRTGDVLVNLVTADVPWPRSEEFATHLQGSCPYVTTALWTVNATRANVAIGPVREVFFGPGTLRERLGPWEFEIAAGGFFQTNTLQAERLFERVVGWTCPTPTPVLDLYSGAGAISLCLSPRASHVTGVESHHDSVESARRNAERNRIANCEFVCADTLQFLKEQSLDRWRRGAVIVDPPRAGLHPKVVKILGETGPDRIVYVSCNTAAFARDLEMLGGRYRLTRLAAVDMFPHTPHIESAALLERDSIPSSGVTP